MTTKHDDIRSHLLSLVQDPGFQVETAQIQAKALLSEVVGQVPPYRWSYIARRVIRNVVMATFELEILASENPDAITDLSAAARKFALIWESFAQLREATTRETALLNAAVNYELAGYQANAMCIARNLSRNGAREEKPSLINMTALFLQRRFLQLRDISREAQVEPAVDQGVQESLVEAMALALAGNAFAQAIRFFLRGDAQALQRAIDTWKNAESLFAALSLVEETNVIRSMRSLLPVMQKRATWTLLPDFAPHQPKWQRYLKLLARGVGTDVYRGRSISELWPSQMTAITHGLLSTTANKIIRMPTSAGKTRIAELAIVHTLVHNPGAKCVYVAPYRALVAELQQSFFHLLNDLGYQISSVTGAYESDDFEELLIRDADVLVITPEKLDLLLRVKPDFLAKVQLIVLDEAHIVHDQRRGMKYELLLTRLMRKLPTARYIILSAVIPQESLEDFARWFNASSQEDMLTSSWRPSLQRYALFEWRGQTGVMRYTPEEDVQVLREFVPGIIHQQLFEYTNPQTGRIKRKRFPDGNSKAQVAAELAYKFAELGPVLVFCTQTNFVEAVARALQEKLEILTLTGHTVPAYFAGSPERRAALLAHEWLGDRPFADWFNAGIGVHYGALPEVIRHAVETDFRQGKLRVLIATNTLAQGVNLPVKTVIFHSCWRYVDGTRERLSARDYWNVAGRAGRAGEETESLVIHMQTSQTDERDFAYYLSAREHVEPVDSALYQKLVALVQNRLSEEALATELDPEILALLTEEEPDLILGNASHEPLEGSLVHIQAKRRSFPLQPLGEVFVRVARDLTAGVVSPELRAVYSSTGLSSTSCRMLHTHIDEHKKRITSLFSQSGLAQHDDVIDLLLPVCLEISEMQSDREFGGSYRDLLRSWVAGTAIHELMAEFREQASSSEELGRFIDDLFGYRLPWGMASYIRMAVALLALEDTEISDVVKFLPSMVKFGVPEPMACWAMSAGIPLRRTAIELAAACRNELVTPHYEAFLAWLSSLSSERLHDEFGLTSPMLEDVSKAIFVSSVNPLLKQFTTLDAFLPYDVEVRGIGYENRAVVALQAHPEQSVTLVRDYDNLLDRNAIAVRLLHQDMGYIPRNVAQILAPEMDTGSTLGATILHVDRKQHPPRVSIRIEMK
jgi:superfamily II DNA/RNA helicase